MIKPDCNVSYFKRLFSLNSFKYLIPGILIIILGLAAIWSYLYLDQDVYSFLSKKPLNWHKNDYVRSFAYLGKAWLLIWLPLIWFIVTGRQRAVLTVILAMILVVLLVQPIKYCVRRTRPYEIYRAQQRGEQEHHIYSSLSFPSGDTASAFAVLSVVASFLTWPYIIPLSFVSILVGILRITEMAHYPSDVFFGAAVGIIAGWFAMLIDKKWLPLVPPKFVLKRNMAVITIILIPIILFFSEGIEKLLLFLKICIPLAGIILLYSKTVSLETSEI